MQQPPGYIYSKDPNYVCKLHKSLSPFIFQTTQTIIYLLLYVADIIITGNNPSHISSLIVVLSSTFELKDLGPLSYFLGIQIQPTKYVLP